jgi:4-cresol dehydrogenase (hydroxylating) flavoprotein subunit
MPTLVGELAQALGADAVLTSEDDLRELRDPYSYAGWDGHEASAVVLPGSVEDVQAVVRLANEHGAPLWTISHGRNLAYGGPAPCVPGSVVVSLRRMDRVLEVDDDLAYALVEPGVRFFDLCEAVRPRGLWASVPVLGWGSVVGNTLEHGWGYTPNGDHAANQCGMEVVLASGEVLRTGMGALAGGRTWQTYKRGFGPSADGLFMQSNLGIVTKMGMWLMPQPEAYVPCMVTVPRDEDLAALVEALRPLLLDRTIPNYPLLGPAFGAPGWSLRFALYGREAVVEAQLAIVEQELGAIAGAALTARRYSGEAVAEQAADADPFHRFQAGIPGMEALEVVKARGGEHAGQLDLSPVGNLTGPEAVRLCGLVRALVERHGFDYTPGIIVTPRSLIHITPLTFDTTDEDQVRRAYDAYAAIVPELAAAGYGLYRAHLDFMDVVADSFDWGGHAMRRFQETLKDALDPNGILSPGKQGIWPRARR